VAVLGVILVLPAIVRAQDVIIVGTVTDSTDAVLPGVTVTALKVDNGNTFVEVTDGSGNYRLSVRPGVYKVTADLTGFTPVVRNNVELQVGQRTVLNLKMALSSVAESVTVTGEAPIVDVTQSKLGGNIDRRQVEELPVNGRNFMDLSMLAPGSRANSIAESPLERDQPGGGGAQLNIDGQQVTDLVSSTGFGQPRYSKDAIAEFEMIANRFDATQGHASGVQVNVVTKSGTNTYAGSIGGYFRSDKFNAADLVVHKVLPYSDQQVSTTFGGPIIKDKFHFFANYEYERNPQTYVFTTPYALFNAIDLTGDQVLYTMGLKFDYQVSPQTHSAVRLYRYHNNLPYDPRNTGGGAQTVSAAATTARSSDSYFGQLSKTFGPRVVNELRGGRNSFWFASDGIVPHTPRITLLGLAMGKPTNYPQDLKEIRWSLRDDLTMLFNAGGRHEFKVGGEYLNNNTRLFWWQIGDGTLVANGGPIPANIEQLFPDEYDPSTWNLDGLSKVAVRWQQSYGDHNFDNPVAVGSTWVQDNWAISPRLTANLGLRYEIAENALAEYYTLSPFLPNTRTSAKDLFSPRLGAAYNFNKGRTVIRGGFGKFYPELSDATNYSTGISVLTAVPATSNDKRPDFPSNPYNGHPPTIAQAFATRRDATVSIVSPNLQMPYTYQSSIGVMHQLNDSMSFQADYVYTASRAEINSRNQNVSYDPVTGINNPVTNIALLPVPSWGIVNTQYSDGYSNYHGLQTAFNKRFGHHWQMTATYTLSALRDISSPCPGPTAFIPVAVSTCPADLGGEYTLAATDQRHRLVTNGIWTLPYDIQLSGLYFFGSGQRFATSFGGDRRLLGAGASGRLAADGSIVPRNDFVGSPIHRVDIRLLKRVTFLRTVKADGILEVFNLFNHENYGAYVTTTAQTTYGQPAQNTAVAYQPRIVQLGFRVTF
jgi:hypothetical protein